MNALLDFVNTRATRAAWSYAVHTVVGLVLFTIIASSAVIFNYVATLLTKNELPSVVASTLTYIEYAILILDVAMITMFQISLTVRYIREFWSVTSRER